MSTGQPTAAQKARALLSRLSEFNSDPEQLLSQLDEIQQKSMDGWEQQKVSAKDGVLDLVEKYPDIARRCVMDKLAVVQDLRKVAEDATESQLTFTVNVVPLKTD
jgi:hypothetical protein